MGVWSPGPGPTEGADMFTGDGAVDSVRGLGGNDILNGNGGADDLQGDDGIDQLFGGEGDDALLEGEYGYQPGQAFNGGNGTDRLIILSGDDPLPLYSSTIVSIEAIQFSGLGPSSWVIFSSDQIGGGAISATATLAGHPNTNDRVEIVMSSAGAFAVNFTYDIGWNQTTYDAVRVTGSSGDDTIDGGAKIDELFGGDGADTLNGNDGSDQLDGGVGNDTINGGAGFDIITGGQGVDTIHAGTNDDYIRIFSGDLGAGETYDGGDGADRIDLYGLNAAYDLTGVTFLSIEQIVNNVQLPATSTDMAFEASQLGAGLSNTLQFGGSVNSIETIRIYNTTGVADYSLAGWQFTDWSAGDGDAVVLYGSAGNNTIVGSSQGDFFDGLEGNDIFTGAAGNDYINGNLGFDQANFGYSSDGVTFTRSTDGSWLVTGGAEGADRTLYVELAHFTDRDVHFDNAENNFYGGGTSDILFRRSDGLVATWQVTGTTIDAAAFLATAPSATWSVLGTAEVNGDGYDDIIWRRSDGLVYVWQMNDGGIGSAQAVAGIGADWSYLGAGDFNGDTRDDIAWQRTDGLVYIWTMDGPSISAGAAVAGLSNVWRLEGVGDFNSDGRDDFLWRRSDTGQTVIWRMNGASIASSGQTSVQAGLDWTVVGVGDTNADGRDDIILRRAGDGMVAVWTMDGTTVTSNHNVAAANPAQWEIAAIGDYNGDGRDDILWQRADGVVFTWLLNGTSIIGSGTLSGLDASWDIIGGG